MGRVKHCETRKSVAFIIGHNTQHLEVRIDLGLGGGTLNREGMSVLGFFLR